MLRAYKYRLYPNKEQSDLINKHIGACRFIYNLALETKNFAYASHRKKLSCFDLISQIPDLKKECIWLKEIDSQALQQSVINLDKAFTQFFKGHASFPNFKSKRRGSQSFRNPHGNKVFVDGNKIFQPKFLEGIKFVQDRKLTGEIRSTTISRTPTGKYFISVLVETGKKLPKKKPIKEETAIGIDLGLNHFIVTSNGEKIDNPRYLKEALIKLKYLQRQASKKTKGSNNKKRAYHKIALQHEKIANQRKDFLHKLSSRLVSENQTLCFEDLNIKGMSAQCKPKQDEDGKYLPNGQSAKSGLNKSILDAGWGMFFDFCKYKSEWQGKNVLQIPRFEPSTILCNKCGAVNHTLTLADREWVCTNCETLHDRDENAAKNIKNYSLKNCVGLQRGKRVELPTMVGALKHEVPALR